jgi:hypothetical protein
VVRVPHREDSSSIFTSTLKIGSHPFLQFRLLPRPFPAPVTVKHQIRCWIETEVSYWLVSFEISAVSRFTVPQMQQYTTYRRYASANHSMRSFSPGLKMRPYFTQRNLSHNCCVIIAEPCMCHHAICTSDDASVVKSVAGFQYIPARGPGKTRVSQASGYAPRNRVP